MGRLIEVDTAIIAAVGYIEEWNGSPSMYHRRKITEKFMTLPTVDAVPVVRCKDCKYSHMTINGECKYCDIWFPDEAEYTDGDYYCASGERKDGE